MFDKVTPGNWITLAIVVAGLVSAWTLIGYRLDQAELTESALGEKIKSVMGSTVSIDAFDKVAEELKQVHFTQIETTAVLHISVARIDERIKEVWAHIEALQVKEHQHE